MKKALSEATHFLLLCLLVSACTIDYDVDIPSSSINKLVLSACLETESPIICKFYTCKSNDKYDPAKEVNVTLKEDGQIIYQGQEIEFKLPKEAMDQGVVIVHQELNMINHLTVALSLI